MKPAWKESKEDLHAMLSMSKNAFKVLWVPSSLKRIICSPLSWIPHSRFGVSGSLAFRKSIPCGNVRECNHWEAIELLECLQLSTQEDPFEGRSRDGDREVSMWLPNDHYIHNIHLSWANTRLWRTIFVSYLLCRCSIIGWSRIPTALQECSEWLVMEILDKEVATVSIFLPKHIDKLRRKFTSVMHIKSKSS